MENPCISPKSLDKQLDAVAHADRRRLLTTLLDGQSQVTTPITVEELQNKTALFDETVALHHQHLPKLADLGVIQWDRQHNHVTRGPEFDELRPLLEMLRDY